MIITLLLLLSALCLSAIAGYFSVVGMTAIFAAAWWPVIIMTGMLEFSKVVVASWLYRNWKATPLFIKSYLTVAVVVLMFITSLGIFGYLSKAHIDQGVGMGDNTLMVSQIDQQIQVEKIRIEDNRKVIQQMDEAVSSILSQSTQANTQRANRGSTMAQQAAKLRDQQKKDRDSLNRSIDEGNSRIRILNQEKLKLEQSQLKLEAEVGPIKYIAQMIYGDNPDKNLLERAVRYVIILIIFVFDPLAVLMIIAANMSMLQMSGVRTRKPEPVRAQDNVSTDALSNLDPYKDIRANDDRNAITWTDAPTAMGHVSIPVRYPLTRAAEATVAQPTKLSQPAQVPAADTIVATEMSHTTALGIHSEPIKMSAVTYPKPVQSQLPAGATDKEFVQLPAVDAEPAVVMQQPPVPEEAPAASSAQGDVTAKKPDDILHKIKQYHTVRLDDAKRTVR